MANCTLCGEPMQPGEEMFKFHGSLGPCPKPPLDKPKVMSIVEYMHRNEDGRYWLDIVADRTTTQTLGPFTTESDRQRAHDDLMAMMRSVGAKDLPNYTQ